MRAVVLFFERYWGYFDTWLQLVIAFVNPFTFLAGAEYASRRERSGYFTGLLSLVALAAFILNLVVIGDVFNIASTERALLARGAFALLLAYRYQLRLQLAAGLLFTMSHLAAPLTSQMGLPAKTRASAACECEDAPADP